MKKIIEHLRKRLTCFWQGHDLFQSRGFERTCRRCDARWGADYFAWRATGRPKWVRLGGRHELSGAEEKTTGVG